jgi:uncharacterized membrane protein
MESYIVDWISLLARWLHVIAGVAWIGASLYFVRLDNSLLPPRQPEDAKRGVSGEMWAVHGGGFYMNRKFPLGPIGEKLSDHLHWSKWEAYTTWLSGMALLAVIYWWGAGTYLIDPAVRTLTVPAAIAFSAGSLVAGWIAYDLLCRTVRNEAALAALLYGGLVAAAWVYGQVFGARAAYIHVGALMGTVMVWNVFFHIIPGQKKMVAAIRGGREPDAAPGIIGKQRSVHNTYFTLPVLFIMISNHYPMTYANKYSWLVLAAIMLAGALIRQYFVLRQTGANSVVLPAIAIVLLLATALAIAPQPAAENTAATRVTFAQVQPVIQMRCAVCHAAKPNFPGMAQPPNGVMLDTPERIRAAAPRILQQAVITRAMPIGNVTGITDEERRLLGSWLAGGAKTD